MFDNDPHNEIDTQAWMLDGNGYEPVTDEHGYHSVKVTKRTGDDDQSLKTKGQKFIALMGVRAETANLWPNVPVTLIADTPTYREFREVFVPPSPTLSAV